MDKELLIAMYEMKDPKRRRKLYEFFQGLFDQNLSAALTVELINKELGAPLTVLYDVKYIRSHAVGEKKVDNQCDQTGQGPGCSCDTSQWI